MKMVEVIEIWQEAKDGEYAPMFNLETQKNLKRIAIIVNGSPVKLEENIVCDKKYLPEEEYKQLFDKL